MYNYLVERMYKEYKVVTDENNIHFVSNGKIVGTLYRKEQVLNIFLSASSDVVWNHHGIALFVVAKKYTVLNNAKARNTEAAWLIGCCGAESQRTLNNPMYLETGLFFGDMNVSGMSRVYKGNGCVKFNLFDMEVEWKEKEQPYFLLESCSCLPCKVWRKEGEKCEGISSQKARLGIWTWIPNSGKL